MTGANSVAYPAIRSVASSGVSLELENDAHLSDNMPVHSAVSSDATSGIRVAIYSAVMDSVREVSR